MNKLSHLTRTSFLLAFFFLLDKVIAFGRSILIARQFSLSSELDAFNVANNLPDLLFALISGGAIAMAFIPLLTETLASKGRAAAWDLFSRVANFAFLVTLIFAIFVAIFAHQIVRAQIGIAPGFTPEQQDLVARLMQLNLIGTILFSISGLVMASLQANQHFLLPAIAPTLYNVGMIFGALVLSPSQPYHFAGITLPAYGLGVYGLVYGVILGAVMHLAIQIPGLVRYGFRWTPALNLRDSGLLQALTLIGPRLLTMFGIQLIFILRDNFASRLDQVGGVSALTYGWMIMQVPETIIGTAIATALLPTLSEYVARHDWEKFNEALSKGLSVMISLSLPIAAVLALYIKPLIQLAFDFDNTGTELLTITTQVYLITLVGYVVQETLARAFYARLDPRIPLIGIGVRLTLYIIIVLAGFNLLKNPGAPVIAAGELAVLAEAVLLFVILAKKMRQPIEIRSALLRGLTAVLCVAGLFLLAVRLLPLENPIFALALMSFSGLMALAVVWKDAGGIFRL